MAALTVEGILPSTIAQVLFDEDYGGIGNWQPIVNGVLIPGVENVTFNVPQPGYAEVRTDARDLADAKYPVLGSDYYIEFDCATGQQRVEMALRSLTPRALTALNSARNVGSVGGAAPSTTGTAEWYCLKVTTGATDVFEIPRLDYLNLKTSNVKVYLYNGTAETVVDVTAALASGGGAAPFALSYPDDNSAYLGNIKMSRTAAAFVAGQTFTYDRNTPVKAHFSSSADVKVIDAKHTDPELASGDTACIVGVVYAFGQVDTTYVDSYNFLYHLLSRPSVDTGLEFWMPLGKSATSRYFKRRLVHRGELTNIPGFDGTSGGSSAPNKITYRYDILRIPGQNATTAKNVSDLYEEDTIVVPV